MCRGDCTSNTVSAAVEMSTDSNSKKLKCLVTAPLVPPAQWPFLNKCLIEIHQVKHRSVRCSGETGVSAVLSGLKVICVFEFKCALHTGCFSRHAKMVLGKILNPVHSSECEYVCECLRERVSQT